MSQLKAMYQLAVALNGTGRIYLHPNIIYLIDTSGVGGGSVNVTALMPPSFSCEPGDRIVVKKMTNDSNGIALTAWAGEQVNAGPAAVINTYKTSHTYIPGCPAAFGKGWVSW